MKKEANEDFREVFTYSNFKRTLAENQEVKQQISEIMQRLERLDEVEKLKG